MTRTAAVALSFLVASGYMQQSPLSPLPTPNGQQPAAGQLAETGVPLSLARERAARISNLRYELDLRIPDTVSQRVSGRVVVSFDLKDPSTPLALDFGGPAEAVKTTTV